MKEFKDNKGRLAVLISQYQANSLNGEEDLIRQDICLLLADMPFSEKRKVVKSLRADVKSTVIRNLEVRDMQLKRRRK